MVKSFFHNLKNATCLSLQEGENTPIPDISELPGNCLVFQAKAAVWMQSSVAGESIVCLGKMFVQFIYFLFHSGSEGSGHDPLKRECLSHPPFPERCHSCDKEGFIMPQFGTFIIYSL